ncbi:MAG: hypothetical protein ACE14M_16550 [Terriglobales bacterium]
MSVISDIFNSYKRALTGSRQVYTSLYAERAENGREFYEKFFNRLIIPYRDRFANTTSREYVARQVERFFGTRHIDFVAIDGTCYKDPFSDFIVFFGGAYGAKGRVSLEGHPPVIKYQRWEMNRDVSMVAWVPVPFAQLAEVTGPEARETFLVSDADRVNLASIHTMLMQLAEVFLAYNVAVSSVTDAPRLIMLDQSISGILAAASHGANTELAGYPYDRRSLDQSDIVVAFAHPFNSDLGVPSAKRFRRYTAILAYFHQQNIRTATYAELEHALGIARNELDSDLKYLEEKRLCKRDADAVNLTVNCRESWAYTVNLFQNICTRLFIQKDQSALNYEKPDPDDSGRKRQVWMSPDDVSFLIAVGLRALIEACWERRILLIGIVKDSESRYLTRNYLGVMKRIGAYPDLEQLSVGLLPWTDRMFLESIPLVCDDELEAPWATVEFDSTFMTVHLGEYNGRQVVMGVRTPGGEMVAPERLCLRSLAQFYLNRSKKTPLMGHVVFVDRLACPAWDTDTRRQITDSRASLGQMEPFVYLDRDADNVGQAIAMYLLSTLTRNHFPEVIGYPDPLHKADLGAKSVGQRVKGIVQSSEISFRSNPIAKTLRAIRDAQRR